MNCPKCNIPLAAAVYESTVAVDRCPHCRGLWLDKNELEQLEEAARPHHPGATFQMDSVARTFELRSKASLPAITCPKCARPLERKEYGFCSAILIDVCPTCEGLWLDRDELETLEGFFEVAREEVEETELTGRLKHLLSGLLHSFSKPTNNR